MDALLQLVLLVAFVAVTHADLASTPQTSTTEWPRISELLAPSTTSTGPHGQVVVALKAGLYTPASQLYVAPGESYVLRGVGAGGESTTVVDLSASALNPSTFTSQAPVLLSSGSTLELWDLELQLPPLPDDLAPINLLAHVFSALATAASPADGPNQAAPRVVLRGVTVLAASCSDLDAFSTSLCGPDNRRYTPASSMQILSGVVLYGNGSMPLAAPSANVEAAAEGHAAVAQLFNTRLTCGGSSSAGGGGGGPPPPWACSATSVGSVVQLRDVATELLATTSTTVLVSLEDHISLDTLEGVEWWELQVRPGMTLVLLGDPTSSEGKTQINLSGRRGDTQFASSSFNPRLIGYVYMYDVELIGLSYPENITGASSLLAAWVHSVKLRGAPAIPFGGVGMVRKNGAFFTCHRCTVAVPDLEAAWWRNAAAGRVGHSFRLVSSSNGSSSVSGNSSGSTVALAPISIGFLTDSSVVTRPGTVEFIDLTVLPCSSAALAAAAPAATAAALHQQQSTGLTGPPAIASSAAGTAACTAATSAADTDWPLARGLTPEEAATLELSHIRFFTDLWRPSHIFGYSCLQGLVHMSISPDPFDSVFEMLPLKQQHGTIMNGSSSSRRRGTLLMDFEEPTLLVMRDKARDPVTGRGDVLDTSAAAEEDRSSSCTLSAPPQQHGSPRVFYDMQGWETLVYFPSDGNARLTLQGLLLWNLHSSSYSSSAVPPVVVQQAASGDSSVEVEHEGLNGVGGSEGAADSNNNDSPPSSIWPNGMPSRPPNPPPPPPLVAYPELPDVIEHMRQLVLPLWYFRLERLAFGASQLRLHNVTIVVPPAELALVLRLLHQAGRLPPSATELESRDAASNGRAMPATTAVGGGGHERRRSLLEEPAEAELLEAMQQPTCTHAMLLGFAKASQVDSYSPDTVHFASLQHLGWQGTDITVTSASPDDAPTVRMVADTMLGPELEASCPPTPPAPLSPPSLPSPPAQDSGEPSPPPNHRPSQPIPQPLDAAGTIPTTSSSSGAASSPQPWSSNSASSSPAPSSSSSAAALAIGLSVGICSAAVMLVGLVVFLAVRRQRRRRQQYQQAQLIKYQNNDEKQEERQWKEQQQEEKEETNGCMGSEDSSSKGNPREDNALTGGDDGSSAMPLVVMCGAAAPATPTSRTTPTALWSSSPEPEAGHAARPMGQQSVDIQEEVTKFLCDQQSSLGLLASDTQHTSLGLMSASGNKGDPTVATAGGGHPWADLTHMHVVMLGGHQRQGLLGHTSAIIGGQQPPRQGITGIINRAAGVLGAENTRKDGANETAVVLHCVLGRGSSGVVYAGTWRGLTVAVKTLVVHDALLGDEGKRRQQAVLEAAISSSMDHPNVVSTYAYEVKRLGTDPSADVADVGEAGGVHMLAGDSIHQLFIVQELCVAGSLRGALEAGVAAGGLASGGHAARFAVVLGLEVALGLQHIHGRGIVHGDVSSLNVLLAVRQRDESAACAVTRTRPPEGTAGMVASAPPASPRAAAGLRGSGCGSGTAAAGSDDRSGSQRLQAEANAALGAGWLPPVVAKVSDFGLSTRMQEGQTHASNMFQGNPMYMAPEVLASGRLSKAADVYSFAMVLLELCLGKAAQHLMQQRAEQLGRPAGTKDAVAAAAAARAATALAATTAPGAADKTTSTAADADAVGSSRRCAAAAVSPYCGARQLCEELLPESCPAALRTLLQGCLAPVPQDRPDVDQVVLELSGVLRSMA